jgi:hypothetical protein
MGAMTVSVQQDTLIGADSPLYRGIHLASVSGGQETNPMWVPRVSDANFHAALENSLALHTLLAHQPAARFELRAHLERLQQPVAGLNMTVKAEVHYLLRDTQTSASVFDQSIQSSYTAAVGDALAATERLRLAIEGAMRANIEEFIRSLLQGNAARAGPARSDHEEA